MNRPPFEAGLAQLADGVYTYLQPDGGLGLSNAGLVGGKGDALLVDTFFDLAHTRRMLDEIARRVTGEIGRVVNTHHNGDHCWGNQLLPGAEIIGHRLCAELMRSQPPEAMQRVKDAPDTVPAARALREGLARFDFTGIELTPPTTFVSTRDAPRARRRRARAALRRPRAHRRRRDRAPAGRSASCSPATCSSATARRSAGRARSRSWIAALERIAALGARHRRARPRAGVRSRGRARAARLPRSTCAPRRAPLPDRGERRRGGVAHRPRTVRRAGSSPSASCSTSTAPTASCAASRGTRRSTSAA